MVTVNVQREERRSPLLRTQSYMYLSVINFLRFKHSCSFTEDFHVMSSNKAAM